MVRLAGYLVTFFAPQQQPRSVYTTCTTESLARAWGRTYAKPWETFIVDAVWEEVH